MKKILLLIFSNILFAQSVPEPSSVSSISPPPYTDIEATSIDNEVHEAIQPFIDVKKYGLGIIEYYATAGYSSTGATFKIINPSKKTIKYIWFTVAGENPVGDLVKTKVGFYKTLKGIGPVENLEVSTWSFDYVWFTDVVETLKISAIKIQYMDGTFRTIKYNKGMYLGERAYDKLILALNKQKNSEIKQEAREQRYVSPNDSNIYTDVDQTAEFPGGVNAFRNKVSSAFDESVMKGDEGAVKTEVTFIVEKDGSISDVKATGKNQDFNNEAVRTVKTIKAKWSPAKISSIPVRYLYRLPLTMNFEG
ncbi:energy transducer TonB [Chryseobacterium sp. T16E-39]|uniref:energy transducer TonB n=1 Tax=Chryseobacterium sp. T16E-39 TaxID=2015076 RepID=UPI00161E41EF|nr:energy transducer TonB [Chryseobacterium sp. T16E-39]